MPETVEAFPPIPDVPELRGRVLLASIGAGVPGAIASQLTSAVAAEAVRHGYRAVVTESGEVSGVPPTPPRRLPDPPKCSHCRRPIRRYPSGKPYHHRCTPAGVWEIPLPACYDRPPLSENQRLHWRHRHQLTAQLRSDAFKLARHHKLPKLEQVRVTLHWQPAVRRSRDSDNPTPTLKALADGLTDAGLVPDDTHDRMEKRVEIHDPQPGQKGRMWLTVERLKVVWKAEVAG